MISGGIMKNKFQLTSLIPVLNLSVFVLLFALSPGSSTAGPLVTISADRQFQFAEQYFHEKEYYRAIGEYRRFIHYFPKDNRHEEALYKIGMSYFNGEKFQEALDAFKGVLEKFPKTKLETKIRFMISECLIHLKDRPSAVSLLISIAEENEDQDTVDEAYYRLGWVYLGSFLWDEAESAFKKISSKNWEKYQLMALSNDLSQKDNIKTKSPRIAGILAVLPGAGHLYCKRYKDAGMSFLFNTVMILAACEAFDEDVEVLGSFLAMFELGFYAGNIYSAVSSAHKFNRNEKRKLFKYLEENSRVNLGVINDRNSKKPALFLSWQISF